MSALVLWAVLASAPPSFELKAGAQLGLPHLVGATAQGTFLVDGRPRFDVDVLWEPSASLQSYSAGAAYHVVDSPFFVGGRVRLLEFSAPWGRGGAEPYLGLGLEAGARWRVGPDHGGQVHLGLFGTWVPAQARNLAAMVGLSVGFSWAVFAR
jgi:hypothetical protein